MVVMVNNNFLILFTVYSVSKDYGDDYNLPSSAAKVQLFFNSKFKIQNSKLGFYNPFMIEFEQK